MKKLSIVLILLCVALPAVAKMQVTVSILPQQFFVEKIAGDRVDVNVMVMPGGSPATYEPKPRQMAALSKSVIYFSVGAPFEAVWLKRIADTNKKMIVVHTDEGIKKLPMSKHRHGNDDHDNHGHMEKHAEHHDEHGVREILDPHIWISPQLVKIQAANIKGALVKADPAGADVYKKNYDTFMAEIDSLDEQIRQIIKNVSGKKFMVFHPSWGYFAKDYGLTQIPVEVEGKSPSPKELAHLIYEAKEEGIQSVFVQPQFSKKSAETIAKQIGGKTVVADPLAKNWNENLLKITDVFTQELK